MVIFSGGKRLLAEGQLLEETLCSTAGGKEKDCEVDKYGKCSSAQGS